MPRVDAPRYAFAPVSSGGSTQSVLPVPGSNASTEPTPFGAYSASPILSGVPRNCLAARICGACARTLESSDGRRHATHKRAGDYLRGRSDRRGMLSPRPRHPSAEPFAPAVGPRCACAHLPADQPLPAIETDPSSRAVMVPHTRRRAARWARTGRPRFLVAGGWHVTLRFQAWCFRASCGIPDGSTILPFATAERSRSTSVVYALPVRVRAVTPTEGTGRRGVGRARQPDPRRPLDVVGDRQ